jgi:general nucleoside transport system ATP-binding protein
MLSEGDAGRDVVLRLSGITKRFGPLVANDSISLTLRRGEIVGLLGENGAGKTTLMNILFGHYLAEAGTIDVEGNSLPPGSPAAALAAGIGMVHQHFTLADNLSVLDNILLGTEPLLSIRSYREGARLRMLKLGEEFGLVIDPDALVSQLSVGERQRVEILKALFRNVKILILDEPTAVLTPQESSALFETLRRFAKSGLSVIFISHKLGEILVSCHRVAVLRSGRLVADREVVGATRGELAEIMVGRPVVPAQAEPNTAGEVALKLDNVTARKGTQKLSKISLQVKSGQTTGIAGVSGNGQNLLADVVAGLVELDAGSLSIDGQELDALTPEGMVRRGVARIPEDRHAEGLVGDMTVTENLISESYRTARFSRFGIIDWTRSRKFALQVIDDYDVKCPSPEVPVRQLSGGNMQKLILGRVMSNKPIVILANQPTRGLDVGAVKYVHEQLLIARSRGAAILLISEDLDELFSLSDEICVMYRGQLSEPIVREETTISQLGLMMAGHSFEQVEANHAT